MDLKQTMNSVLRKVRSNSPSILTGIAVAGVVSTSVMAAKATPAAMDRLADAAYDRAQNDDIPMNGLDKVKLVWRDYAPAVVMGGATIACIVGANTVNSRRNAALVGLYSITDNTLKEYQSKVIETIGAEKEEKIQSKILEERMESRPVSNEYIYSTGKGDVLCFDDLSGRYFRSSREAVEKAMNDVNKDIIHGWSASVNELYRYLGLPNVAMGSMLEWTSDALVELSITSKVSESGEPCLIVAHYVAPKPTFR